jgi:parvulin-like peptidyl-prolyl isomerase
MNSEYREVEEPKDRTWLLWVGLGLVLCLMVAAMALYTRGDATRSVVRARHILIAFNKHDPVDRERALKQITELRERIVNGEDFAQIAADYSQDPLSARRGGDLNYAERGAYTADFENYVWTAPIGELSDVIETDFGFHLIRVEDRVVSEVDRVVMEQEREIREELKERREGAAEESATP